MTRVRIAIGILSALILLSAGSVFAVRKSCSNVLDTLHQVGLAEQSGNTENAKKLCKHAEERWDSVQWILKLCVSYDKLSETDKAISRLEPMIDADCDEFRSELISAETMLRNISEGETPYITNIF